MEIQRLVKFLRLLKSNNNKEFFTENRAEYDLLRNEFIDLVRNLISDITKFDKNFKLMDAKDCLFRINRDIRFSKDKSPYKTNFSAYFGNRKDYDSPAYYFHIDEKGNLLIAGGVYMISNNKLELIRRSIVSKPEIFEEIIYDKEIDNTFGGFSTEMKLKKAPRGYAETEPLIEYLKLKNFIFSKEFDVNKIKDQELENIIIKHFKLTLPLIQWLRIVLK